MIYTVTGAMPARHFGRILMHEHVCCASNDLLHTFGKQWLDKERLAAYAGRILAAMRGESGLGLFVDGTPIDLGRDVRLLQEVSALSGVPIVASTGLYWFPSCVTAGRSPQEIASWFLAEWQNGMEGTEAKPGILKCATEESALTDDNRRRLTALGIAQRESGLPLYVHSSYQAHVAEEQLRILREAGADPEKILFGHAARRPDADCLATLLKAGCYVTMDQCHCVPHGAAEIGGCLAELWRRGYGKQLLLANDLCIYSDFASRDSSGLELTETCQKERFFSTLSRVGASFCEAGGNAERWEQMFCENPVRALDVS